MNIPILDLKPQYQRIKAEIQQAVNGVLESGQFILGKTVADFEQAAADYLGVKYAIGVNSGTDALMIGLRALGIGPGDEVITTPFSFFATAESISNVGAKPVFVDVAITDFNLDPDKIKAAITPRTKAIMPVHLFGQPAAMAQIKALADAHGLKIIEDCAQSFGAIYAGDCLGCDQGCDDQVRQALVGQYTGAMGDVGAFSFFPTKNLGAYGDGGLITTNDPAIADLARCLRVHGSKQRYQNEMLGYNSRLDALQAAILNVKLSHLKEWSLGRRRVAQTYNDLFQGVEGIITPTITAGHVFHQYTLRILNGQRDALANAMQGMGISTMIYYPVPQDQLPVYRGQYAPNPISDRLATEVLSLPIWPEMETETVQTVAEKISQVLPSL
ncbi:pleiotropic regulatory protein [Synechocystis sp. PCC 6803]|uniref:Pleiotropic regulatory protein n=1 Tax=Synechocystis sp. (strain ATCC 27184 / PCC 6803 / Kazusa) TaxID=1111708 RepID=P74668_SYNY3|nr:MULTISPECIES: DegT/DnrJ/EryC1/StrS family aminotransferase [unclassified Synechocystis]BAM53343.1 pleiotropic regulatory protein [Synechocystis sp. PCC 6803] [Bacillus subtilis BEST7613]AGF53335.1 pleiotropic regulatory protein [Synechocystis sp. PCC 6803]ALJ69206.1 erythromycin biosynthesis sensory transduction protein eryC1 [Synechocystis sp. PCC 6803]AVP91072.1 erythromycin biosynthesis sensory transduction protein eryC1 [Synechocystis sp. IPPAS B-1465]MBD2618199.1 DegT/DnrJ/EryC1/StrS f